MTENLDKANGTKTPAGISRRRGKPTREPSTAPENTKPPKKQISPRISVKSAGMLASFDDNLNAAASYALEAWPTLYQRALAEIRGRFTRDEVQLIIDALEGSKMLAPRMAGQRLGLDIDDAVTLHGYHKRYGIEAARLQKTIAALTSFQRVAIELWAATARSGESRSEERLTLLAGDSD